MTDERAVRLQRLHILREKDINPYPNRFDRTHSLAAINAAHGAQSLEELEKLAKDVRVAGRVMTLRGQGKVTFATLSDGEARLQVYVRQDDVGEAIHFDHGSSFDRIGLVDKRDIVMTPREGPISPRRSGRSSCRGPARGPGRR